LIGIYKVKQMNRKTLQPKISTPIPKYGVTFKRDKAIAKIKTNVKIELLKDKQSYSIQPGASAETYFTWETMPWQGKALQKIREAFEERSKRKLNQSNHVWCSPGYTFYIQTVYRKLNDRDKLSAYGFGTNIWDKRKTLRFHEGSHGQSFINYIKRTALPQIKVFDGMTTANMTKELEMLSKKLLDLQKKMNSNSSLIVDCIGSQLPDPSLVQCQLPFYIQAEFQQMFRQFPFDAFVGHK